MGFSFTCHGHQNITSKHKNTLEFTKDDLVTEKGDCIVGCKADFEFEELMEFVGKNKGKEVRITISVGGVSEIVEGIINPDFNDDREIVVRKSEFNSKRTLVIRADKGATDFSEEFRKVISDPNTKIEIFIEVIPNK